MQMLRGREPVTSSLRGAQWERDSSENVRMKMSNSRVSCRMLVAEWSKSLNRLAVVGEPGSGKTYTALQLIQSVNAQYLVHSMGRPAELFPINDWPPFKQNNPERGLRQWLAYEISCNYPKIPLPAACQMIDENMIVPVFDGLDEIPKNWLREFIHELNDYAGFKSYNRPYVLTSRVLEYTEAADDLYVDQTMIILPLEPKDVVSAIQDRGPLSPLSRRVVETLEDNDVQLARLLENPLRFRMSLLRGPN